MFSGRATHVVIQSLDWLAERLLPSDKSPEHLRVGVRGEEDAYFSLRKSGYLVVAQNYRSSKYPGEIDLIAWDHDVLCFIEVKTRKTRDLKTGVAAVDRHKRREIAQVALEYLRQAAPLCQWRFDVVSVYYDSCNPHPQIELFRNASLGA
jgi:putative endonuclease